MTLASVIDGETDWLYGLFAAITTGSPAAGPTFKTGNYLQTYIGAAEAGNLINGYKYTLGHYVDELEIIGKIDFSDFVYGDSLVAQRATISIGYDLLLLGSFYVNQANPTKVYFTTSAETAVDTGILKSQPFIYRLKVIRSDATHITTTAWIKTLTEDAVNFYTEATVETSYDMHDAYCYYKVDVRKGAGDGTSSICGIKDYGFFLKTKVYTP